jgi:hypothetical protein
MASTVNRSGTICSAASIFSGRIGSGVLIAMNPTTIIIRPSNKTQITLPNPIQANVSSAVRRCSRRSCTAPHTVQTDKKNPGSAMAVHQTSWTPAVSGSIRMFPVDKLISGFNNRLKTLDTLLQGFVLLLQRRDGGFDPRVLRLMGASQPLPQDLT